MALLLRGVRVRAAAVLAIALTSSLSNPVAAQDVRPMTTAQAAALAARIVVAKCKAVEVRAVDGGNIFTFSDFQTLQTVKGTISSTFTLRLLGGRLGDVEIDAPGMPRFVAGEEVVLFLGLDNATGHPTIFPQGVFRITTQGGVKTVQPAPTGLTLFRAADNSPYKDQPAFVPLNDFVHSLRLATR